MQNEIKGHRRSTKLGCDHFAQFVVTSCSRIIVSSYTGVAKTITSDAASDENVVKIAFFCQWRRRETGPRFDIERAFNQYNPDSKFRGADRGPSGADRTQVGPMLAPWTLLFRRIPFCGDKTILRMSYFHNDISYTGKTQYLLLQGPFRP